MKLTWHIVLKDLCRLRWALVMLLALTAAKLGIGVLALRGSTTAWNFALGGGLILAMELMLRYMLVASFVLGDSLVDVGTDWQTRPISGGRLLVAKLMGLILALVILPLVLLVPWWLHCDFGTEDIAFALREYIGWQVVLLLLGLPIAATTGGYARFLLWTAMLVLGGMVFGMDALGKEGGVTPQLGQTRLWLGATLGVILAITVTVRQFCGRSTRLNRQIMSFGALGGAALVAFWPWVLMDAQGIVDKPRVDGITAVPERLEMASTPATAAPSQKYFLTGLPEDAMVSGGFAEQTYCWPDGTKFTTKGFLQIDMEVPRKMLGLEPLAAKTEKTPLGAILLGAPQAQIRRLFNEGAKLSGGLKVYLQRLHSVRERSTALGAKWSEGPRAQWTTAINPDGSGAAVTVVERLPAHGDPDGAVGIMEVSPRWRDNYWFVNRERGQLRPAATAGRDGLRIAGVIICRTELKFSPNETDPSSGTPTEMLRGWSLARLSVTFSGLVPVPIVPTTVMAVSR